MRGAVHLLPRFLQDPTTPGMPGSTEIPLDTVLRIETTQCRQLVQHIGTVLNQLQLALVGTVDMSPTLQQVASDLSRKQVRGISPLSSAL